MTRLTRNIASRLVGVALFAVIPFAALADVEVQNAQYRSDKDALYVKGRLTGDGVAEVYIVNATSNALIGSIRTQAKGSQFGEELPVAAGKVPCRIKVQTTAPRRSFFGRGSSTTSGEFTIATVQQAPENCN